MTEKLRIKLSKLVYRAYTENGDFTDAEMLAILKMIETYKD